MADVEGEETQDHEIDSYLKQYLNNRFIFMRWKEKFLIRDGEHIDDDDEDEINGASFDGFYYIVHDQVDGSIHGFYYHKDAEKFQQLELVPVFNERSSHPSSTFEFA